MLQPVEGKLVCKLKFLVNDSKTLRDNLATKTTTCLLFGHCFLVVVSRIDNQQILRVNNL